MAAMKVHVVVVQTQERREWPATNSLMPVDRRYTQWVIVSRSLTHPATLRRALVHTGEIGECVDSIEVLAASQALNGR